jgi:adenylyltransferase/sulfurtransferase
MADLTARYSRQILLSEIGRAGQEKLQQATALIIGCGALGSIAAACLARAGVGKIRIADRDIVELDNLHRQFLFDEQDAASGLPKAVASAQKLARINSTIKIEPLVLDVTTRNIAELTDGVDVVVDGTDNFETRYLINDFCLKNNISWVYGGVIGTHGMSLSIRPGNTPCLRCLFPTAPVPGSLPTCDTVGVLNTVAAIVASTQATEAIKIILGKCGKATLLYVDPWHRIWREIQVEKADNCPCCVAGNYEFLRPHHVAWTTTLCGRNAVQVSPSAEVNLDLESLARTLANVGDATYNGITLRFKLNIHDMIIFPDGRAIIRGTTDEPTARSLYARYVGI